MQHQKAPDISDAAPESTAKKQALSFPEERKRPSVATGGLLLGDYEIKINFLKN